MLGLGANMEFTFFFFLTPSLFTGINTKENQFKEKGEIKAKTKTILWIQTLL